MPSITRTLIDYEMDLIRVIAAQWDIDLLANERVGAAEELSAAITTPEAVQETWERLSDEEQEALSDLLANEGRMSSAHFVRRYGDLRPMGPARREREKPWLDPESVTEALYYRGLIVRVFEQTPAGAQEHIAIPDDIARHLPHPTRSADETPGHAVAPPRRLKEGHATAPDDMATLLAYLLLRETNAREWLRPTPVPEIDRHLRRPETPAYRALLTRLAYDMELIDDTEVLTHVATNVRRDAARAWLEAPRQHQQRSLAEAWLASTGWNELAFVPGLEADQWPNNPRGGRRAILEEMADIPAEIWWSLDAFIAHVKETNPDFQRPAGDYGSWYLRDTDTGEILHGFQYWDYVEGALIRLIIEGPMRWLGLVRAGRGTLKLTPLGLALQERADWPSQADREMHVRVDAQGVISVPVHVSRYDRLQIARFAAWISAPQPAPFLPDGDSRDEGAFLYRLTPQAIERVMEEGVSILSHIIPFLQRVTGHNVPDTVLTMLEGWHEEPKEVIVHDVVLVTAKDLGVYERLRENRYINRWLGQKIGPHAHIVKRENMPALMNALREMGILPLFEGHEKDDWPI